MLSITKLPSAWPLTTKAVVITHGHHHGSENEAYEFQSVAVGHGHSL